MKDRVYIDGSRGTFKGNVHMHSLWSDGIRPASQVAERYRSRGYHFICLSDHDVYTDTEEFDADGFIAIPGMERGGLNPEKDKDPGYHFGVLGDPEAEPERPRYRHLERLPRPIAWTGEDSPQILIDELASRGNLVIFNHPEWHLTRFEDMVRYRGFFAVEIFNYATEWTPATSYGTAYWDHALQNGRRVYGIAGDDAHRQDDGAVPDFDGGWIEVQADGLSRRDIVRGLKRGSFYSSSGPRIHDLRVVGGRLEVECSPCTFIMFKAFPRRGEFLADFGRGRPLTAASNRIVDEMEYIRVECIDAHGKVAWSNPVFVKDLL